MTTPSVREALEELTTVAAEFHPSSVGYGKRLEPPCRMCDAILAARAALAAPPSEIPREPTEAMILAGRRYVESVINVHGDPLPVSTFWRAMYDAAPKSAVSDPPPAKERGSQGSKHTNLTTEGPRLTEDDISGDVLSHTKT
jgi:hypothetical protein